MGNFELIVLCLMIPIMYVVVYMAGRVDVIGSFIKMSMEAKKKNKLPNDISERIHYVIEQFEEAKLCASLKNDPLARARAEVLKYVIDILKEDLLMEDLGDEHND